MTPLITLAGVLIAAVAAGVAVWRTTIAAGAHDHIAVVHHYQHSTSECAMPRASDRSEVIVPWRTVSEPPNDLKHGRR